MSVAVPVVASFNGAERRIYLKEGVDDFYPIEDIYHEYRNARRLNEDLRKFEPLIKAEGNVAKGAGKYTPRYLVFLTKGTPAITTKIIPFDESKQINQKGDIITDIPDTDPFIYDISQLTTAKPIYIEPPGAEVIRLDSAAIEYASFGGGVSIDILSNNTGTKFPTGSQEYPVNNVTDARIIAFERGFKTFFIRGDITFSELDDISGFLIIGENASRTLITIEDEAITNNCEICEAFVTGILDYGIIIRRCVIQDLTYVDGVIWNTVINPGTITLGNNAVGHFLDCYSGLPGTGTPIIDMGGSGQALAMRNYNGGIKLINKTGADPVSIDMNSGQIKLASDVTDGDIVLRGVGTLTEDFSDGANVINQLINTSINEIQKVTTNKVTKQGDIITIYEDDGITVWKQFDLANGGRVEL